MIVVDSCFETSRRCTTIVTNDAVPPLFTGPLFSEYDLHEQCFRRAPSFRAHNLNFRTSTTWRPPNIKGPKLDRPKVNIGVTLEKSGTSSNVDGMCSCPDPVSTPTPRHHNSSNAPVTNWAVACSKRTHP